MNRPDVAGHVMANVEADYVARWRTGGSRVNGMSGRRRYSDLDREDVQTWKNFSVGGDDYPRIGLIYRRKL